MRSRVSLSLLPLLHTCPQIQVNNSVGVKFANKLCGGVGVTNIPQTATCAATAATGSASSTASSTPDASSASSSSSSSSSDSTSGAVTLAQNPLLVALGAVVAVFV